jgi:hypothetical protein
MAVKQAALCVNFTGVKLTPGAGSALDWPLVVTQGLVSLVGTDVCVPCAGRGTCDVLAGRCVVRARR